MTSAPNLTHDAGRDGSLSAQFFQAPFLSLLQQTDVRATWWQLLRNAIIPQGVRNVLADLVGNTHEQAKQTSIACAVALRKSKVDADCPRRQL